MIHRVSDFSLFNSNILLLSHNNVTPEVPEELPPPQFLAYQFTPFQPGAGGGQIMPVILLPPPSPRFLDGTASLDSYFATVVNARRVVSHNNSLDFSPAKTNSIFLQGLFYIKTSQYSAFLFIFRLLIQIKSYKRIIGPSYPTKISNVE